jgi:hypothetical protein
LCGDFASPLFPKKVLLPEVKGEVGNPSKNPLLSDGFVSDGFGPRLGVSFDDGFRNPPAAFAGRFPFTPFFFVEAANH